MQGKRRWRASASKPAGHSPGDEGGCPIAMTMKNSLSNKVVIITGASGGIGSAVASQLVEENCRLGLIARNEARLKDVASAIRAVGGRVSCACADVRHSEQLSEAFGQVTGQLGPIDILIASAGLGDVDQMDPFSAAHYERLMQVNWVGLVNTIENVLPEMLARQQGHLVAISSLRAYKGLPGLAGYSATKAAVNSFMDGLRVDLRDRGISVTTICPGFVRTAMTDRKQFAKPFMMEPEEAARKIVWALRRRPKVYNFPWQAHLLMRISRRMPDWVLARLAPR